MRVFPCLVAVVTFGVLTTGVRATPTGIVTIPTAAVVGPGWVRADFFGQGAELFRRQESDRLLGATFGLGRGVEAGLDLSVSGGGGGPWWNAKWQLPLAHPQRQAVAVGLANVARGCAAEPYLAVAQALGRNRAHLGVIGADHSTRLMAGAEVPAAKHFEFVSDYISGPRAGTSAGFIWSFPPASGVIASHIWRRGADQDDQWFLYLYYGFRLG